MITARAAQALLADGAGSPLDQGVASLLFIGALLFGWIAVARLRGKGFLGLPRIGGWFAATLSAACLVLAFVLPPIIRPVTTTRPSSPAKIEILSPANGEIFHGTPATIAIRVRVTGGRIVPFTTKTITPTTGHVHILIDGALVAMTTSVSTVARVDPGSHILVAEFVAADHGPFSPRVLASASFEVDP